MICERCEDLQAHIADLEAELGLRVNAEWKARFAKGLRTTPGNATILAVLYAAGDQFTSTWRLMEATETQLGDDNRDDKQIAVRINGLRRALGRDAIETRYGLGYRLTPAGRACVAPHIEARP